MTPKSSNYSSHERETQMKNYTRQDIANANQAYNDFMRNGWNSGFGQVLKSQNYVISPGALPLAIFILQQTFQNYKNRTDLWQPLYQAISASVGNYKADM